MELNYKRGQLKKLDEKGEGIAVIATLNVIDSDHDVTVPGAFGKQITPMVPAHNWQEVPIGKANVYETDSEVLADFKLNLKTEGGREWYEALKFDFENPPVKQEYSYGYSILLEGADFGTFQGEQVRFLKKIKVHEVSPVLLGAGVATRTLTIKSQGSETLEQIIALRREITVGLKHIMTRDHIVDLKLLSEIYSELEPLLNELKEVISASDHEERGRLLVGRYEVIRQKILDRSGMRVVE